MKNIKHAIPVYLLVLFVLTFNTLAGSRIVVFGVNTDTPARTEEMIAISAGYMHSLSLTVSGEVVGWGENICGQATIPQDGLTSITAIAAGGMHSLALKKSGKVIAWGDNSARQSSVPSTATENIKSISAGLLHSMALTKKGKVIAWGDSQFGQTYVPNGLNKVVAVSAGALHSLALDSDGRVYAWGDNSFSQMAVPEQATYSITAIAAGYFHNLALTTNGTVIAWGDNSFGQCTVPPEALYGVVAISAGQDHCLALKTNGQVVMWGNRSSITPFRNSSSLPFLTSISAGGYHSLGLIPSDTDSNQNGIPDWWEIQNKLDPSAAANPVTDSDNDGYSDHEEYLTNTNPWDNESYFKISIATSDEGSAQEVIFQPVSDERLYTLEYVSDITKNNWAPVPGHTALRGVRTTQPGVMSITPVNTVRFYRVRASVDE